MVVDGALYLARSVEFLHFPPFRWEQAGSARIYIAQRHVCCLHLRNTRLPFQRNDGKDASSPGDRDGRAGPHGDQAHAAGDR